MQEASFHAELERRLELLETADTGESPLPDLPRLDIWIATVGLAILIVAAITWGYPA